MLNFSSKCFKKQKQNYYNFLVYLENHINYNKYFFQNLISYSFDKFLEVLGKI